MSYRSQHVCSYPLEGGDPEKRHIIELNFDGGDSVRVQANLLNAPYPQNQFSSWTCNPHPVLLLHCFLGRAKDCVLLGASLQSAPCVRQG